MSLQLTCPDVEAVMAGLKDFQRATVDYVFQRLYLDRDYTRRFLIADEVGLGKTLVARGLIARAIHHLQQQGVGRIDVVYICSNAEIARQNVARLNVMGCEEFQLASRITLLPTQLHNLKERPVNFVSFTPGTSFNLHSSTGIGKERALLYSLLQKPWDLRGAAPLNVFQVDMGKDKFREWATGFRVSNRVDPELARAFLDTLAEHPNVRTQFDELCERYARSRKHIPRDDRRMQAEFIGTLRKLLTVSCLRALEPDLVILDEFQRFKHLLNPDDPAGLLAGELFNYADQHSKARVILLSATPYKMYTVTDEANGEDHYADFLHTMRFLQDDPAATETLERTLNAYRQELFRLHNGDLQRLRTVKDDLERQLRRVMVRTERLAVTTDRDGMLSERPCVELALQPADVKGYLHIQQVARAIEHADVTEYWKSAPYLLSFMEDYELKRAFHRARTTRPAELAAALRQADGVIVPWRQIEKYAAVDPANARLRSLLADTVEIGAWQWLWMPPSLPYYQLAGPYRTASAASFTKRLIFTAWRVAPKAIATLVSYEAERRMFHALEAEPDNTPDARRRRRPLLRFQVSDQRRLTGMPVLALVYPSTVLAEIGDPLRRLHGQTPLNALPTLSTILREVEQEIETRLAPIVARYAMFETVDDAWYWAAPLLLDLEATEQNRAWLQRSSLAVAWAGQVQEKEDDGEESHWADHVAEAQRVLSRRLGRPPKDLVNVLALMAVAGPGPSALRALARVIGDDLSQPLPAVRDAAAQVAFAFRSLFNVPEATAMIRGLAGRDPYWRDVLQYCADGGLSAVLDEYAHILRESQGLLGHPPDEMAGGLARSIYDALTLRTSSMDVDEISVDEQGCQVKPQRMRGRFALRFGRERNADDMETTRQEKVRDAFNSPFWPFALATTSIGQEGLDFHPYCHAIVHWNLPANPVDLEQREGRVHRYKGHAVRKNLARRYGVPPLTNGKCDPWEVLFDRAAEDRKKSGDTSDLVPFWIYPLPGGATIERYVPALPLSRDQAHYTALKRALAVYRMVFGQSRQEDLLTFLLEHLSKSDAQAVADQLRIDLSPPTIKASIDV